MVEDYLYLLFEFVCWFNDKVVEVCVEMIKWSLKFLKIRVDLNVAFIFVSAAIVMK